jgi:hypothetical protein
MTFFCITAISGTVFYFASMPSDRVIYAVNGVIDLRSAGLDSDVFTLGGEWEFYWGRLYTPEDFFEGSPEDKTIIEAPATWRSAGYPRTGHATYRLRLLTPPGSNLVMYIPEILGASRVWVGDGMVYSAGEIGSSPSESVSYSQSDIVLLPVRNDAAEIVIQVSNYDRFNGGIRHPFRLGLDSTLPRAVFGRWLLLAAVSGAFFSIGFYHIALFLFQSKARRDIIYLIFAACCILAGTRLIIETDGVAQYFSRSAMNIWLNPIYWFLTTAQSCFYSIFSLIAFEIKLGKRGRNAFAAAICFSFIVQLALPPLLSRLAMFLFQAIQLAVLFMAARGLTLERVKERPYLGLYFLTTVLYVLVLPLGTLSFRAYFFATPVLSNVFLILSQFIMLSQDYADARRNAEELAAKADFYHRMAHNLLTPLTVVSTNVQVVETRTKEDGELMRESQKEIMRMAEIINKALEERVELEKT